MLERSWLLLGAAAGRATEGPKAVKQAAAVMVCSSEVKSTFQREKATTIRQDLPATSFAPSARWANRGTEGPLDESNQVAGNQLLATVRLCYASFGKAVLHSQRLAVLFPAQSGLFKEKVAVRMAHGSSAAAAQLGC